MGCTALFQYLIDSEKKLENRFDLPAGGLQFGFFSSSFPMCCPGSRKVMYGHGLQIGVLDQTAVALAAFYGVLLVIFMIESGIRINFYCVV